MRASARLSLPHGAAGASGTRAPEIGLSVYRLDLPDGSFFTASWYEGDEFFPGGSMGNVNRPRFNLCNKGGKLKAGSKAESLLTDKLKELRKELLRDA